MFALTKSKAHTILLTMKDVIVTITSKNQITLPAQYVRKLKLTRNRTLKVTEKRGVLELKPQPSFEEVMAPIWKEMKKQLKGKKPLTDEELNQAIRDPYAEVDVKDHNW